MKLLLEIPNFGEFKRESGYSLLEVEIPLVLKKQTNNLGKIYKVITNSHFYELTISPSGDYSAFVYPIDHLKNQILWNGASDGRILGFVYQLFGLGVSELKASNMDDFLADFEFVSQRFKSKLFEDEQVLRFISNKSKLAEDLSVSGTIQKIMKENG